MSCIAYLLTWTCYGSWLPGDPRGSVVREARKGAPFEPSNPALATYARKAQRDPPVVLDERMRTVVDEAIREHAEFRGWRVIAMNVRTNHVHLVVRADVGPERVMASTKARATRRLRDEGLIEPGRRVWTQHGSTRWIDTEESLVRAVDYVLNRQ